MTVTENSLVVPCILSFSNAITLNTYAFVDCGATGESFLDIDFVRKNNLIQIPLPRPRNIIVVDGSISTTGSVTHEVRHTLTIGDHSEEISSFVTKLDKHEALIGMPWLRKHNPAIDWEKNTLCFNKDKCRKNCLKAGVHQSLIKGRVTTKDAPAGPITREQSDREKTLQSHHDFAAKPRLVGAAAFQLLSQDNDINIFSASIREVEDQIKHLEDGTTCECSDLDICLAGASMEDIQKALEPKIYIDPKTMLPDWVPWPKYTPVFDAKAAEKLPPHRDCDHKIALKPGAKVPSGQLYGMSIDELQVLRKFIDENLARGFIRPSKSPAASPVLFAKKPGGGLRFCVDYRALNALTIKNRYPLPLLRETLARLSKAKYYTKLDVIGAFNRIRMAEGDEWLTAFNTRYGLFESMVMPFGLCNAPATFQARINEVLHEYLDVFCTAYIDDVLIFSDSKEEHREHVLKVLDKLQEAGLQLDIKKCAFEVTEVTYLGMIISTEGVRMDPKKVECITKWEAPESVKDVQGFLGFANFYRRFIKNFSKIVRCLNALTKKDVKFKWSKECEAAFEKLKKAFTSAPTLKHFDPALQIFIETDASDYVSSAVLSQIHDGILHPVAFMSKKFDPAECNYEIYDKELYAIVQGFQEWRPELQGAEYPITVLSDHKNLETFMTTKQLSRRQVRWSEFLSQFDWVVKFRPGKQGGKPDALTRRSQDLPKNESDERLQYQHKAIITPANLEAAPLTLEEALQFCKIWCPAQESQLDQLSLAPLNIEEPLDHQINRRLEEGYKDDAFFAEIKEEMAKELPHSKKVSLSECKIIDNMLYFRDRIYVPEGNDLRTLLLQTVHDSVDAGHPGKNKMYDIVSRDYWWPNLSKDSATFVKNCHDCARNKINRQRYSGTLKPLPVPMQRWREISVDFVGPFAQKSDGFDGIMVTVDRLSKERHYSPCIMNMNAEDLATIFIRDVWKHHGLPSSIVSDRGTLFVSEFWRAVCHILNVKLLLSSSYHPESDGQTEVANSYMLAYLRQYIDFLQKDWAKWLPLAEFAANNAMNVSTGVSPFFANKGFHPRMSFGPPRTVPAGSSRTIRKKNIDGTAFATKMEEISTILQDNMKRAQAAQEVQANKNRTPGPAYKVGDLVFLDRRNITSAKLISKLDNKYLGPFAIKKLLNSHAYQLELPHELKSIDNSFHTNLLYPAPTNPLPGQKQSPPPPVSFDEHGQQTWQIEEITNSRLVTIEGQKGVHFEYQISWRGGESTWEPLKNVINAKASIAEYQRRYPRKKRPTAAQIAAARAALACEDDKDEGVEIAAIVEEKEDMSSDKQVRFSKTMEYVYDDSSEPGAELGDEDESDYSNYSDHSDYGTDEDEEDQVEEIVREDLM